MSSAAFSPLFSRPLDCARQIIFHKENPGIDYEFYVPVEKKEAERERERPPERERELPRERPRERDPGRSSLRSTSAPSSSSSSFPHLLHSSMVSSALLNASPAEFHPTLRSPTFIFSKLLKETLVQPMSSESDRRVYGSGRVWSRAKWEGLLY